MTTSSNFSSQHGTIKYQMALTEYTPIYCSIVNLISLHLLEMALKVVR